MIKTNRQSGFSLLEVMMAVVVMTMGMVFVASMFPVGLYNARKTAESTIQVMESKNAAVMAELAIKDALSEDIYNRNKAVLFGDDFEQTKDFHQGFVFNMHLDNNTGVSNFPIIFSDFVGYYPDRVHFMARPNVFCNSGKVFFADTDFEFSIDEGEIKLSDIVYRYLTSSNHLGLTPAAAMFYLSHPMATFFDPYVKTANYYYDSSNFFVAIDTFQSDIGKIMCPPIDETNEEVLALVNQASGGNYSLINPSDRKNYLYPAINQVAMKKKFNWAVFYQEQDNGRLPGKLIIFILKQPSGNNVRFAMQNPTTMVLDTPDYAFAPYINSGSGIGVASPAGLSADYDCVFPVPWKVYLKYPVVNDIETGSSGSETVFTVGEEVGRIIRPGSILIDADPECRVWNTSNRIYDTYGKIFEVVNIELVDYQNKLYDVTLNTNISDAQIPNSLFSFWVFPPPVLRDATGAFVDFADDQPVIDVIVKPFEIE